MHKEIDRPTTRPTTVSDCGKPGLKQICQYLGRKVRWHSHNETDFAELTFTNGRVVGNR